MTDADPDLSGKEQAGIIEACRRAVSAVDRSERRK